MKNLPVFLLIFLLFFQGKENKIKPSRFLNIRLPEPSDITMKPDRSGYYMVSDDGFLIETDVDGKELRRSSERGFDYEGIFLDSSGLWVVDERTRYLSRFDMQSLLPAQTKEIPYSGGRNKGFEAICRNPLNKRLIVITEKDPVWVMELDERLDVCNRILVKGMPEVSSATVWNGNLYFLSDESHCIARINPKDYSVEAKVKIPVINPEGISPACSKGLVISSDDMGRLYFFEDESVLP